MQTSEQPTPETGQAQEGNSWGMLTILVDPDQLPVRKQGKHGPTLEWIQIDSPGSRLELRLCWHGTGHIPTLEVLVGKDDWSRLKNIQPDGTEDVVSLAAAASEATA
ncbi:MAG: hypothetical protein AAGC55_15755, partial [Myxococcota bacterium]